MAPGPSRRPSRRQRLGELLLEAGAVDDTHLKAALMEQRKWGGKLGSLLVDMGFIREEALVSVLARQLELPSVDLDNAKVPERITERLRLDMAERHGVFPLKYEAEHRTLHLATSDPTNVEALQELEFATDSKVSPVVAAPSAIDRAIRRYYFGEETVSVPQLVAQQAAGQVIADPSPSAPGVAQTTFELDQLLGDAPVEKAARSPLPLKAPLPQPTGEAALRRELAVLREQLNSTEALLASQVRALRSLLEVLISSGLVSRQEYLERVHRTDPT
jgi:type IV pilus assembly protein PilB